MKPLLLLCLLLTACGTQTPQPEPVQTATPPKAQVAIRPQAETVREAARISRNEAGLAKLQASNIASVSARQSKTIATMRSEMDRLIKQKTADLEELEALGNMLAQTEGENSHLKAHVDRLLRSHQSLRASLVDLETKIDELQTQATKKDAEVESLKSQLGDANRKVTRLAEERKTLAEQAQKAETDSASARTYRNLVWLGIAIAVILVIVTIAIKQFRP